MGAAKTSTHIGFADITLRRSGTEPTFPIAVSRDRGRPDASFFRLQTPSTGSPPATHSSRMVIEPTIPWSPSGPAPVELSELLFQHRNTVAAATASFISTIAGFPLDSVKSRLQVKRYSSVLDCVQKTYTDEGVKGFYRGVWIPLFTITAVRTASFSIYSGTKETLANVDGFRGGGLGATAVSAFCGGAMSGVALSLGTSAFEFTKIALQLDYLIALKRGIPFVPRGTIRGFLDLYKSGGFRGLYTGFQLHALRDTIGTGLYFCFYDSARWAIANKSHQLPFHINNYAASFVCGSGAGILSWAVIYPIDLVKSKVQRNALAHSPREKPWDIFKRLAAGGFARLYRGLGVSASRSVLTHGTMWTILEAVRGEITRRTGHSPLEDVG